MISPPQPKTSSSLCGEKIIVAPLAGVRASARERERMRRRTILGLILCNCAPMKLRSCFQLISGFLNDIGLLDQAEVDGLQGFCYMIPRELCFNPLAARTPHFLAQLGIVQTGIDFFCQRRGLIGPNQETRAT